MNNSKSLHEILLDVAARTQTLGFRSVTISDIKTVMRSLETASEKSSFQLMNADLIAGPKHIKFAAANAFKAFADRYNMSRTLPTEILRYASTCRQIKDAIKMLGVSASTKRVACVLIDFTKKDAEDFILSLQRICGGTSDNAVIEPSSKTKLNRLIRAYGITDEELYSQMQFAPNPSEAVVNAIIERMAILSIGK